MEGRHTKIYLLSCKIHFVYKLAIMLIVTHWASLSLVGQICHQTYLCWNRYAQNLPPPCTSTFSSFSLITTSSTTIPCTAISSSHSTSHPMDEDDHHIELQLLPSPPPRRTHIEYGTSHSAPSTNLLDSTPSLDLQLSISTGTPVPAAQAFGGCYQYQGNVEALKRQAAEQIRLAAVDKAYAERVRELTRREMELAESEFARARHVWEIAQQEMETAQRMKEKATSRVDSTCVQITCQSCRRRF